jgi:hypothetical protein
MPTSTSRCAAANATNIVAEQYLRGQLGSYESAPPRLSRRSSTDQETSAVLSVTTGMRAQTVVPAPGSLASVR